MREGKVTTEVKEPRPGWPRSIRTKLIVYFSLVFAVVFVLFELVEIFGLPIVPYAGEAGHKRTEAFRSLNLVADLKKERLLRWIEERRDDAHMSATNELVEMNVNRLRAKVHEFTAGGMKGPGLWDLVRKEESYRTLAKFLNNVITTYEVYNRIHIADRLTGMVLVSTDESCLGDHISQHPTFVKALQADDDYISDIDRTSRDINSVLHIGHVIEGKEGEVIGVLLMHLDVDDIVRPMLHTGEGLGERGEALLVNQDVRILTSLKHPLSDGTEAKPLEFQIKAKPAVLAASGEEGIIETDDYRGEPVLAAYRHLRITPYLGWGMVVKRDRAEVFAPLRRQMANAFWIGLAGIIVVVAITIVAARNLTRPILSLSAAAGRVAEGDPDARASVSTSDEIGHLAMTFNSMIERIQERTAEIMKANQQLQREIKDRKRAEEALRRSEGSLAEAQRIAHTGNWDLDLVNNELRWSDEIYRIFGLKPQEFGATYEAFLGTVHPDDRELVDTSYTNSVNNKTPYDIVHRIVRPDGEVRYVHEKAEDVVDETGRTIRSIGTVQDITERRLAEEEIQRQSVVLGAMNRVFREAMACENEEEVGVMCLAVAEELTNSRFGFICEVNQTGRLDTIALSDPGWKECRIPPSRQVLMLNDLEVRGIRGRVVKDGQSMIFNDPLSHPDWIEPPEGHPSITSFLGVPLKREDKTIGMIALANKEAGYTSDDQEDIEALSVVFVEALTHKEAEEQVRTLSSNVLEAHEIERKLVAQDIHDSIGASLAAIKYSLEETHSDIGESQSPDRKSLEKTISMVQNIIEETRRISTDLRPAMLDDLGLLATISWLCREFQEVYSSIQIERQIDVQESEVPESLKTVMFRTLQEALNNVAKHSGADLVRLSLGKTEGGIELCIEDNGQGFDPGEVPRDTGYTEGIGLVSIKERIDLSGGTLNIHANRGGGTRIMASWPSE